MPLFSLWRSKSVGSASQRFRQTSFQERIRRARDFRRKPRISPQAKTSLRLGQFRFTAVYGAMVFVLLVVCVGYFLAFSSYFLVDTVRVQGNNQIPTEAIGEVVRRQTEQRLWGIIPRSHMLLMNARYLEKILLGKFPKLIAVASVERSWPHSITVTIEERTPIAVWQTGDRYYYLGHDGVIADPLPPGYATSTSSYLRVEDTSGRNVTVGENLRMPQLLAFVNLLRTSWQQKTNTTVIKVVLSGRSSSDSDVFASSSAGWTAYFDLRADTGRQLENLRTILRREVPADKQAQLAYIDLRLPTVAYYCFKSEPCAAVTTSPTVDSPKPVK